MRYYQRNYNFIKAFLKFFKRIRVLHKYILDSEVSIFKKLLVIGMLFYVFSPLDFLPDPILGFGFIDDAFIAIYVITLISDELDKYIGKEKGSVIDINKKKIIHDIDYEVRDDETKED